MACSSRRITCGLIRSMTEALRRGIRHTADSFCRSCDKGAVTTTFADYSISPPSTSLPFGAGKPHLSIPGFARTVLGGWTLSTIGSSQTGLPFNITIDRSNGSVPGDYAISGNERPNYVYGAALAPPDGSIPAEWVTGLHFPRPLPGRLAISATTHSALQPFQRWNSRWRRMSPSRNA